MPLVLTSVDQFTHLCLHQKGFETFEITIIYQENTHILLTDGPTICIIPNNHSGIIPACLTGDYFIEVLNDESLHKLAETSSMTKFCLYQGRIQRQTSVACVNASQCSVKVIIWSTIAFDCSIRVTCMNLTVLIKYF